MDPELERISVIRERAEEKAKAAKEKDVARAKAKDKDGGSKAKDTDSTEGRANRAAKAAKPQYITSSMIRVLLSPSSITIRIRCTETSQCQQLVLPRARFALVIMTIVRGK